MGLCIGRGRFYWQSGACDCRGKGETVVFARCIEKLQGTWRQATVIASAIAFFVFLFQFVLSTRLDFSCLHARALGRYLVPLAHRRSGRGRSSVVRVLAGRGRVLALAVARRAVTVGRVRVPPAARRAGPVSEQLTRRGRGQSTVQPTHLGERR